jgi:hypothetical protein
LTPASGAARVSASHDGSGQALLNKNHATSMIPHSIQTGCFSDIGQNRLRAAIQDVT